MVNPTPWGLFGSICAGPAALLAQALTGASNEFVSWMQIVSNVGAIGIVAWIIYKYPAMVKEDREDRNREREMVASERRDLLKAFRDEQTAERAVLANATDKIAASNDRVVKSINEQTRQLNGRLDTLPYAISQACRYHQGPLGAPPACPDGK